MSESRLVEANARTLTCRRCLAENDKTSVVRQAQSQLQGGNQDRMLLVASCIGCGSPILVATQTDGRVEILDDDPDNARAEDATASHEIGLLPIPAEEETATALYEQAAKHFAADNFRDAFACWRAAHEWFSERSTSPEMIASVLSNMGMALSKLHNPEEALPLFEQALLAMDVDDNPEMYATILNNIGGAHLHLGNLSEAERFHRQAYELHLARGSDAGLVIRERHNLAFVYAEEARRRLRADDLDGAVAHVRQATDLYAESNDETRESLFFLMLGNLLCRKGDFARDLGDLELALQLYEEALHQHSVAETGAELRLMVAQKLAAAYRQAGQFDQALRVMEEVDELLEVLSRSRKASLSTWKRRGLMSRLARSVVERLGTVLARLRHGGRLYEDER